MSAGPSAGAARAGAWIRRHIVWLGLAVAYLFVFPYYRQLENPNENVRIWATRALARHGTFALAPVLHEWGDVTDTAAVNGRRYSSKAPGTTLLGVPVHFVHDRAAHLLLGRSPSPMASTWALRIFTVILPLLGFFWWFGRRVEAETESPYARDLLTFGLGLGTMFYPYGLAYVGHAQSAALLFGGFAALLPREGATFSNRRLLLAGGLTGLAVFFEYQALFAAFVVAGFAAYVLRGRVWLFALGALVPALLLGGYHTALFGRPWELPYAHLDDVGYATYHHSQGFLGLGRPRARVLGSALFSVDYGLFIYAPLLLVGFVAAMWAALRRGDAIAAASVLVTAVMAVFLSGMANWRGGWCAAGPRYIAAVVPFLLFAIARTWRELFASRAWAIAVLVGLLIVSVLECALSGLFPHFPVQLDNPLFDLVVPLALRGYVPHNLGTALGLGGLVTLLPWALAVLLPLGFLLRAQPGRARHAGAALGLAAALMTVLALTGRQTREDARVRTFIEGVWEPRPSTLPVTSAGGAVHGVP